VFLRSRSLAELAAILSLAGAALAWRRSLRGRLEHETYARRRSERALEESEERFRELFEQVGDALFVHDDQGRIYNCNAEASRGLGYSRQELLAMRIRDFVSDMLPERERDNKKG
jgi:PAS domain-containing protein